MADFGELSFEFFPPRTLKGRQTILEQCEALKIYHPDFYSVTFGAGGSTLDRTLSTVLTLKQHAINSVPHLSCISCDQVQLRNLLKRYRQVGVKRIVTLRGDLPSGFGQGKGPLRYARQLIEFIRQEQGDYFELIAAAYPEMHPQAVNYETDIQHFVEKMKAGAQRAITQYFYDAEAYFYFVDRVQKLGVDAPIIPGIMPITRFESLARFSKSCGASIPRWMQKQLEAYQDDEASLLAFGLEAVRKLCQRLLENGAPGLHFYTLNQAKPTQKILAAL